MRKRTNQWGQTLNPNQWGQTLSYPHESNKKTDQKQTIRKLSR